jgi:DNA-binding Xre family transcriptional regulator
MIKLRIEERLNGRSLYWLSKETGIAYSTIHRLATTPAQGISFIVLDKLCDAFECQPGDLIFKNSASASIKMRTGNTRRRGT